MELNKTIQNFKEQQKKMHAFDHVMNLLTYDAATGMPPGASDTLSDTPVSYTHLTLPTILRV